MGRLSKPVSHETHARIMWMWASNKTLREISQAVGMRRNRISEIVNAARDHGDERAVYHRYPCGRIRGRQPERMRPRKVRLVPRIAIAQAPI